MVQATPLASVCSDLASSVRAGMSIVCASAKASAASERIRSERRGCGRGIAPSVAKRTLRSASDLAHLRRMPAGGSRKGLTPGVASPAGLVFRGGGGMRFRSGRAVAAGAAAAVAVTGVAVAASPPISSPGRHTQRAARVDLKDPTRKAIPQTSQARPVAASTSRARARLRDSLGRYAQVTVNQQTGGLQAIGRLDGYLTGRSTASATSIALGYVRAHAAAFGLTQQDLDGLKLVRDYTSSPDGVRHLQWAQVVDGITVADSSVLANVASDGRLVNVLGGARGGTLNRRSPAVSADTAYGRTLRSVGSRAAVPAQRSARSTGTRATTYAGSGHAELVAYHAGPGLRLAWRVLAPVSR